jgi:hypothetical protein
MEVNKLEKLAVVVRRGKNKFIIHAHGNLSLTVTTACSLLMVVPHTLLPLLSLLLFQGSPRELAN